MYGFYFVWYKLINFSTLLNLAIQRMCTHSIFCVPDAGNKMNPSHFIFYCKLSKVITPDYISELINLNYSFNIPFKSSLKTITMGLLMNSMMVYQNMNHF